MVLGVARALETLPSQLGRSYSGEMICRMQMWGSQGSSNCRVLFILHMQTVVSAMAKGMVMGYIENHQGTCDNRDDSAGLMRGKDIWLHGQVVY